MKGCLVNYKSLDNGTALNYLHLAFYSNEIYLKTSKLNGFKR